MPSRTAIATRNGRTMARNENTLNVLMIAAFVAIGRF